jgi:hypothetical protein
MNTEVFELQYSDLYDSFSNNTTLFIYYHVYRHNSVTNKQTLNQLIIYINIY